ncbi:hypothetical protein diail_11736 [Diaporthe ilicicola]|nr:hypothetical protein diail_11736 [Diaporthe ilicicola]
MASYNDDGVIAVIRAAEATRSPAIIQLFPWTVKFQGPHFVRYVVETVHAASVPIVVHLDHCIEQADIEEALNLPFDSIMVDASVHDAGENMLQVKKITQIANAKGIAIEAEMGRIEGGEDGLPSVDLDAVLTQPADAKRFIDETGVHFLAPAFGNIHGGYGPGGPEAIWRCDLLEEIHRIVPDTPIVLHGTHGVSDELFRKTRQYGVLKVNVNRTVRDDYTKFVAENAGKLELTVLKLRAVEIYTESIKRVMKDVYITQTEARLRALEDSLRRIAPEELEKAPQVTERCRVGSVPELSQEWLRQPSFSNSRQRETGFSSHQHAQCQPANAAPDVTQGSVQGHGHSHSLSRTQSENIGSAASASPSTQIGPSEPLAHEVGLLSLANATEPKYLGPSSGISFARLIFAAIPQSQGLPTTYWSSPQRHGSDGSTRASLKPALPLPPDWTPEVDLQHFVDAYFETWQPLYPFLNEDDIVGSLDILFTAHSLQMPQLRDIEAALSPFHAVQLFLVVALGARILEARLSSEFTSARYLATAMSRLDRLALHDSLEGLQTMLLLTLSGFCFEHGPNAWFLSQNIIATCLDLGFQRRWQEPPPHNASPEVLGQYETRRDLRRAIFWSAYSIERNLAVVLGRPLTLRDEAVDVQFPGIESVTTGEAMSGLEPSYYSAKRMRVETSPYKAAHYSFRFDQITAEMKLMLYRVVRKPDVFPWITDVTAWQVECHQRCDKLFESLSNDLKWRSRRRSADGIAQRLELKYHQCLMLLHRPSPATPRPRAESWKTCFNSASQTILIHSDMHRFSKMPNTWLTAHTIFVSGITLLYCLWVNAAIKEKTSMDEFNRIASACSALLKVLGKAWSVAADAVEKFDRLVSLTSSSWNSWKEAQAERRTEIAVGASLVSLAQDGAVADTAAGANQADVFDDVGGFNLAEPEFFLTELGDMSSWFDLDWIGEGVAVLYQALEPPVIDGIKKPKKPNGYKDSGADIAYNLSQQKSIGVITPTTDPNPTKDDGWAFPDSEQGILDAINRGATHLWANTSLFASHPLQTSATIGQHAEVVRVIGQSPLCVDRYDNKDWVNSLLRKTGGFTVPRSWAIASGSIPSANALRDLPYPVVAKPVRGRGSHGVKVCRSPEELAAHAKTLADEDAAVMLEEFLQGEEGTVTVMPPTAEKKGYWALPVVSRFNHHDGIAPYNGVVAVTANSRVVSDGEKDPIYAQVMRESERAAELLGVTAPIRIDVRRYSDSPDSKFALFDVNMKPNMTGPGRPGRDHQASLTMMAASALGWDYKELLRQILATSSTLATLRRLKPREISKL